MSILLLRVEESCHTGGQWGPCGQVIFTNKSDKILYFWQKPCINLSLIHIFVVIKTQSIFKIMFLSFISVSLRTPNAKSFQAFQHVAAWKDTLAAHWVDVVMSELFHLISIFIYFSIDLFSHLVNQSIFSTSITQSVIYLFFFRCESDYDCGSQEYCKDFKCHQSCTQCGIGAQCVRVSNHRAICECPKVMTFFSTWKIIRVISWSHILYRPHFNLLQ